MGQVMVFAGPRNIQIEAYDEAPLKVNEVRLHTLYSGISAGTQLTAYRGTNPYALKRWNEPLRVFEVREDDSSIYPVRGGWAYEEVGRVTEVGAEAKGIRIGDIIYGVWGHRSTHIVTEEFALQHKLPEGVDPKAGIFSQMGPIALNAILDANIHVGETIAVFGQGVPGQIVAQLAKQNGAFVIAVDIDDGRLQHSLNFGADAVLNSAKCDAAKEIKTLTQGRGADVSVEISGFAPALHEAIRSTAYNGRVVTSGFYQGEASGLYLGEEFHHNRIQLICSQISGVAPELSTRWNRLRMEQTIMSLEKAKKINLAGLITHVVSFQECARAYDMIDRKTEPSLQVVLEFAQ